MYIHNNMGMYVRTKAHTYVRTYVGILCMYECTYVNEQDANLAYIRTYTCTYIRILYLRTYMANEIVYIHTYIHM